MVIRYAEWQEARLNAVSGEWRYQHDLPSGEYRSPGDVQPAAKYQGRRFLPIARKQMRFELRVLLVCESQCIFLDESFFRVRFDHHTPTEKKYIRAIAKTRAWSASFRGYCSGTWS